MSFFPSAAAAEGKGFRPCLRCRPERAPGLAPVDAVNRLVGAAVAGIEEHALSSARIGELAARLGVSDRHLRRATEAELGVSPIELAQTYRLLLAKRLLHETSLKLTDIAFASGFKSLRRFNASFKERYQSSPRALRGRAVPGDGLRVQLEFRPPLAWACLLDYLRLRAIPGVESVDARHYRRTVALGPHRGWIAVSLNRSGHALTVELSPGLAPVIGAVITRVKRLFDLGAIPQAVASQLARDRQLAVWVRRFPGLRVAGAFDGFELAVRAILGQQVSIKAAATLAGRWAQAFGQTIVTPYPELRLITPEPTRTADAGHDSMVALGIMRPRARALAQLARAVADERIQLSYAADVDAQLEALMRLPGVGPWTAQYIAMRALQWPDAFPSRDLVLLKAAQCSHKDLLKRAEGWRPWRAYAAHYLWRSIGASHDPVYLPRQPHRPALAVVR